MAELIKPELMYFDNMLSITLPKGIEDNCQYEIRLKDFKSKDGFAVLDSYTHSVITGLSPAYCSISDVAVLVDEFQIPESTCLYYIREASKYVDWILETSGRTVENVTFPMREFVKTKSMIDCLLRAYVTKAAGSSLKGTLGELSFGTDEKYAAEIGDLIKDLYDRLKQWEDALKGDYVLEGRAAPSFAIKASKTTKDTKFSEIVDSMERDVPVVEK